MKRRDFIGTSGLAAAGLTSLLASCNTSPVTKSDASTTTEAVPEFQLHEETIAGLQEKFKAGSISSVQATQLYLDRIAAIDNDNFKLNAVIELNPDALGIAKSMDDERKAGKMRGPLHGIPVLIKDNIDTADKMQTTAGALALEGNIAAADAFIVKKLRAAGAVILGKTNLSEWANFRSSNSCSGWSSRGGQTKNPYILDHNPCGSSSGSGVAVSANLCTVAIGTETDGSITCPASTNGVVGIKPTVGLLSRAGIIPISSTQDTAGPLARSVRDAATLLGVLTGVDDNDPVTKESESKIIADYTQSLDANGLRGKRIGIEKKIPGTNQFLHRLQEETVALLKQQGAIIIEIEYLDKISDLGSDEFAVMQHEFKAGVNTYLATANAKVKSLSDVIAYNKNNEDKAMPYFKQETLESSDKMEGLDSVAYKKALQRSHEGAKNILNDVFGKNKLDAIAGLTMGPACSIDQAYGDRWGNVFLTAPAAMSGYPHISIPCGFVYDLPVGFSFFGPAYSEASLIGIGYAFEQASKKRIAPGFRRSFLA